MYIFYLLHSFNYYVLSSYIIGFCIYLFLSYFSLSFPFFVSLFYFVFTFATTLKTLNVHHICFNCVSLIARHAATPLLRITLGPRSLIRNVFPIISATRRFAINLIEFCFDAMLQSAAALKRQRQRQRSRSQSSGGSEGRRKQWNEEKKCSNCCALETSWRASLGGILVQRNQLKRF